MKTLVIFLMSFCIIMRPQTGICQSDEAAQLLLNYEKLAQLKQILSNMKKGYEIISKGYTAVKNVSEGNFNLHKTFMDGLMTVNPAVRNYKRIGDIIGYQKAIVNEYKVAFKVFQQDRNLTVKEIHYLEQVYAQLFHQSMQNLEELIMVTTTNKLQMSDDERLQAIDRIYADMQDKLVFLCKFNSDTKLVTIKRARERRDIETLRKLYGITE